MPGRQLVGLEHPAPLADGEEAAVEGQLQRALRRLAARPGMVLFHQHVVVDVADRQRALRSDAAEHLAQIRRRHRREPDAAALPVPLHGADVEPHVGGRQVGQGMRPVFEHGLVDGLRLAQMLAPVSRNARIQDVVMAAFDHVDGVDLHIAQMLHRRARRRGPVAERRGPVEPLRAQPDAPGVGFRKREGFFGRAGHLRTAVYNRSSSTMRRPRVSGLTPRGRGVGHGNLAARIEPACPLLRLTSGSPSGLVLGGIAVRVGTLQHHRRPSVLLTVGACLGVYVVCAVGFRSLVEPSLAKNQPPPDPVLPYSAAAFAARANPVPLPPVASRSPASTAAMPAAPAPKATPAAKAAPAAKAVPAATAATPRQRRRPRSRQ